MIQIPTLLPMQGCYSALLVADCQLMTADPDFAEFISTQSGLIRTSR